MLGQVTITTSSIQTCVLGQVGCFDVPCIIMSHQMDTDLKLMAQMGYMSSAEIC